jgi:hypothetical protein
MEHFLYYRLVPSVYTQYVATVFGFELSAAHYKHTSILLKYQINSI